MSFSLGTLSAYTEQHAQKLISKSITGAKTASLMQVQTGIKSAETINILETDAVFQAGGTCGFSASGTTTITQRTITVGKIKLQEALCPKSLEAYFTQKMVKAGTPNDLGEIEAGYAEMKSAKIAEALETAIWQGDTTSGTVNLARFDGLIKLLDAARTYAVTNAIVGTGTITCLTSDPTLTGTGTNFDGEVSAGDKIYSGTTLIGTVDSVTSDTALEFTGNAIAAVTGATFTIVPAAAYHFSSPITSITTANVISIVDGVWSSIPNAVKGKDDMRIFMGWDVFEKYVIALRALNLFHYDAANSNGELVVPGTTYKIVAVHGLDSTNRIFAIRESNMYLGTDLQNEEERYEIFFAKEADEVRFMVEFKYGVQVAFPAEVVSFKLVA